MKGQKVLELFALCAPTSHSSTSPLHQPSCPAASVLACMLIPHETLLTAYTRANLLCVPNRYSLRRAGGRHYTLPRSKHLGCQSRLPRITCLLPPLARSQITSGAGPVWRWPPNWPLWPWLKTGTEKAPEATSLTSASTPRSGDAAGRPWRNRSALY